jgi:hypothetical protein
MGESIFLLVDNRRQHCYNNSRWGNTTTAFAPNDDYNKVTAIVCLGRAVTLLFSLMHVPETREPE